MKTYGIYLKIILFSVVLLTLAGCRSDSAATFPKDGEIAVYYTNAAGKKLVWNAYAPQQTEKISLVQELYGRLKVGTEEYLPCVPETMELMEVKASGNLLGLYLTGPYGELKPASKVMMLAAMTRTMAQIDGVSGISVYVDGNPITDESGKVIGILRVTNFVDNAVDNPEDYRDAELTLYFANEKMDKLVRTTRTVTYRSSASLERIIVEQLLQGPKSGDGYATLPSSATLLGVNVRDRICYVNFDEKFITEVIGGYDYIPVYSVVNSLTELPSIDQVQISINGSSEVAFQRDIISFAAPFQKKMEYVEGE